MSNTAARRGPFVLVVVLAAALGAIVVVSVTTILRNADTDETVAPALTIDETIPLDVSGDQLADAQAFIGAWSDFRRAMLRIDSEFVRETIGGDRLETGVVLLQRPPHRLVSRLGGVIGIYEGEGVICDSGINDELTCTRTGARDYVDDLRNELTAFASAFGGDAPAYSVRSTDDGCFELTRQRADVLAEYGRRSEFCFDAATSALVSTVTDHGDVIETSTATSVSVLVTRAEFVELLGEA